MQTRCDYAIFVDGIELDTELLSYRDAMEIAIELKESCFTNISVVPLY